MSREILSLSLDPDLVRRVKALTGSMQDKASLSHVVAELIEAGMSRRGILVFYETDDQRTREEPARVVSEAHRIWGYTPSLKGWADTEWLPKELREACLALDKAMPKMRATPMAVWIAAELRKAGWTTQVVDDRAGDILEVWAHKPGDKCAECPKMARMMEAFNAED